MKRLKWSLALAAGLTAGSVVAASAQQAAAPAPIKLGVVSFLSGPAASPFGVPGRNGAEILIEALNSGKAPAPFDKVGFAGSKIE
ncbi:MAG: ABC transporter substrate-binding protein, partial [Xanthobacteraceae bacterium]